MRQRLWLGLFAAVTLGTGCGGGDEGGGGSGSEDTIPPTFAGVSAAAVVGESRIDLTWPPASDNVSDASRIVYRVYGASGGEEFDFDTPWLVTPSGAESAALTTLVPSNDYRFVVRAVDEAGNEEANTAEATSATPDESPPKFAGVTQVVAQNSRTVLVEWNAAFDKGTPQAGLQYRVYVGVGGAALDFTTPTVTSGPGDSSVLLEDLVPLTDYTVVVRAVDAGGNEDGNVLARTVRTPEGMPPSFIGAKQAIASGQSVTLYWFPASDNVTEAANIVYDIYESTTDRGQDFSTPSYTSEAGQITFVASSLAANTRHYYVVRARDTAGNRDSNTIQVNATTAGETDTTAPTFGGVETVVGASPSSLTVTWNPATDAGTPETRLRYDVFVSDTSGGHDFTNPTLTSPEGATSALVAGLPPNATRFVVVRARDLADQTSLSTKELSGTTLANTSGNTTAPTWAGGPSVVSNPSLGALDVSWTAATDDNHSAAEIRYHVCAEKDPTLCMGASFNSRVRKSTNLGQTTARLTGLESRAVYHIFVRAEDESGNFETGNHSASIATPVSYRFDILPLWRHACNGCHSFQHSTTVNVPGGFVDPDIITPGCGMEGCGLPLIWPGQPENSMIYRRINPRGLTTAPFIAGNPNDYVGLQEPRDGNGLTSTPLSGAQDGLIREWIEQGAFAN